MPPDDQIAFRTHLQALRDWRRARAIHYRQASANDLAALRALDECHPEVGNDCLGYVAAKDRGLLLAWDGDELVALASLSHRPRNQAATIDQVFVLPEYRRWGIATQLVGQAIAYARREGFRTLLAEAPITNPVLFVYLKAGFRVSGFVDTYHPPGREQPVTALFLAYELE
jgi:GNAT superfamily N-acetyltransferase